MKTRNKIQQEVVSCGVDAFTATSRNKAASALVTTVGHQAVAQQVRLGNIAHAVNYHGYVGTRAGSAMVAVNDQGQALIELKGENCLLFARRLYGAHINVTRIDLQITMRFPKDRPDLAKEVADAMPNERAKIVGKNWAKPRMTLGFGEGDTLYLGSRESNKFRRLYNKWLQSKDPLYKNCWRAEIEFKYDDAPTVWRLGQDCDFSPIWIQSIITTDFAGQGCPLPVAHLGDAFVPGATRNETDMEAKLAWIKQQVYPTMQVLCDNGYKEPLMQMLLDLDSPNDAE